MRASRVVETHEPIPLIIERAGPSADSTLVVHSVHYIEYASHCRKKSRDGVNRPSWGQSCSVLQRTLAAVARSGVNHVAAQWIAASRSAANCCQLLRTLGCVHFTDEFLEPCEVGSAAVSIELLDVAGR